MIMNDGIKHMWNITTMAYFEMYDNKSRNTVENLRYNR
jgi:hypothetical protein